MNEFLETATFLTALIIIIPVIAGLVSAWFMWYFVRKWLKKGKVLDKNNET